MKRIELLKKTGICITSIALAAMVGAASPSMIVRASDTEQDMEPALGATLDEGADEIPSDEDESNGDNNANSSEEGLDDANADSTIPAVEGSGGDVDADNGEDDSASNKSDDGEDPNSGSESDDADSSSGNSGTDSEDEDSSSGSSDSGSDSSDSSSGSSSSGSEGEDSSSGSSGSGSDSSDSSSGSSGSGSGSSDSSSGSSGSGSDSSDSSSGSSGSGSDSSDSSSGSSGSGSEGEDSSSGSSGSGSDSSDSSSGSSGSGSDSSDSSSGSSGSSNTDSGSANSGSGNSSSDSGTTNSGSDSSDTSSGSTSNDTDEGENERKPVVIDPSNIPYAGGVSEPTLVIPDSDPFAAIAAPSSDLDSSSIVGTPTTASAPTASATGTTWSTAAPLQGQGTLLDPNEYPTGYAAAANYTGTNEQLIASQNIVSGLSVLNDGFRFYTIDKDLAVASTAQSVYEDMNTGAREVGQLADNNILYVLSEENDGWLYVESGNVRGFVPAAQILRGADADSAIAQMQSSSADALTGSDTTVPDVTLSYATETVPAGQNTAFAYKRCTTKTTVIDKEYAVSDTDMPILEEAVSGARQVGTLPSGGLCYVLLQADDQWAYVESGNVRGFAPVSSLTTGNAAKKIVQRTGEATMSKAQQLILPTENAALYYTLTSTQEGASFSNVRTDIVKTASECIGSPYKWGGNSLKGGCDCSGFVKQLYALYGYNLPRVAEDQSKFGTQIPIGDAAPGDLIFFAANGYVYHVALYAGDGMTIEAFSEDRGIIATSIGSRDAVWATRIIQD